MQPFLYAVFGLLTAVSGQAAESPATAKYLRCEYCANPLGIDVVEPRLSWEMHDARAAPGRRPTNSSWPPLPKSWPPARPTYGTAAASLPTNRRRLSMPAGRLLRGCYAIGRSACGTPTAIRPRLVRPCGAWGSCPRELLGSLPRFHLLPCQALRAFACLAFLCLGRYEQTCSRLRPEQVTTHHQP